MSKPLHARTCITTHHNDSVDTADPRMLLLRPRSLTTATTVLATHHGSHTHTTLVTATHDPHHAQTHSLTEHRTCSARTLRSRCTLYTAHAHSTPATHKQTHTAHTQHVPQGRQPGHHRRKAAADLVVGQAQVPARTHMHHHSPPGQASTQPSHAYRCCTAHAHYSHNSTRNPPRLTHALHTRSLVTATHNHHRNKNLPRTSVLDHK